MQHNLLGILLFIFKTLVVYSVNAEVGPGIVVHISSTLCLWSDLPSIGLALPRVGKPATNDGVAKEGKNAVSWPFLAANWAS